MAYCVPALEQVPAGHATVFLASVHTPPEQLPLPFIRSAEALVVRTIELKNASDIVIAKNLMRNPPSPTAGAGKL
jgi:hypothetical protein